MSSEAAILIVIYFRTYIDKSRLLSTGINIEYFDYATFFSDID